MRIKPSYSLILIICLLSLGMMGCGTENAAANNSKQEYTVQTGEGLVLEGEGPFPAVLIARSKNTLSNEENQLILQEMSQELDKIMDLAGQLEVIDDAAIE